MQGSLLLKNITSYILLVTLRKSNLLQLHISYSLKKVTSNILLVTFFINKYNKNHLFCSKIMFSTNSLANFSSDMTALRITNTIYKRILLILVNGLIYRKIRKVIIMTN